MRLCRRNRDGRRAGEGWGWLSAIFPGAWPRLRIRSLRDEGKDQDPWRGGAAPRLERSGDRPRKPVRAAFRLAVAGAELVGVRVAALLFQFASTFESVEHHVIALVAGVLVDRVRGIELIRIVNLP